MLLEKISSDVSLRLRICYREESLLEVNAEGSLHLPTLQIVIPVMTCNCRGIEKTVFIITNIILLVWSYNEKKIPHIWILKYSLFCYCRYIKKTVFMMMIIIIIFPVWSYNENKITLYLIAETILKTICIF